MFCAMKGRTMKNALVTVVAALTAVSAFAADAYIESDGSSGILTEYRLKPTSRIEVDFALTTVEQASGARLFGADRSHTALRLSGSFFVGGNDNSLWVIHLGNGAAYDSVWPKDGNDDFISLDTDRHTIVIDYPNPPHLFITGGVTNEVPNQDFTPASFTNESIEAIALFARQNSAGAFEKQCKARIYDVKIYESGALIHDFLPCLKDGMPGFRDIVGEGGFICNPTAETSFTYGGDILVDESPYVATPTGNNADADKHLYIDTLYYPSGDTRLELDYALQEAQTSGTWYLFSGTSRFCSYLSSAGIGFGVLSTWGSRSIAKSVSNVPGVRRTAVLDNPGRIAAVITAGYTNDTLAITNTATYSQTATIKLCAIAAANDYFSSAKIYGCRIYEAGTLVRDFRPYVLGPLDGGPAVVGLKDELTGTFVSYPAATASKRLSCGGKMELPPYVETLRADSRYIDTGYFVTANTKVAIDYAPAEARTAGDTWYLFCAKDTHNFAAYINDRGFGFINSTSWKMDVGAEVGASAENIRRTVILDNPESLGVVMTEGVTNAICATATGGPFNRLTLKIATQQNAAANFASIRIYGCKIWEKENGAYVLKRDYMPAIKEGVAGLQDILPNGQFKACATTATTPLAYGGAFTPTVTPATSSVVHGRTAPLTASAPGATSYRWLRNGEPIPGGESGSLAAAYLRDKTTDAYQVIAVYTVDDMTAESAASACVFVESKPSAMVLVVR